MSAVEYVESVRARRLVMPPVRARALPPRRRPEGLAESRFDQAAAVLRDRQLREEAEREWEARGRK